MCKGVRKGAISAEKDKLCVISLNMRDGVLICKGKGNEDWNYSSAHGCGRLMSRKDAVLNFNLKDYQKAMENVYSTCINRDKNSTFNMKKIFDHYIKTGQRLQNYQRCSTAVKSRQ